MKESAIELIRRGFWLGLGAFSAYNLLTIVLSYVTFSIMS